MSIDAIGNFLTVIRNGLMVRKRSVTVPFSRLKLEMARVLKEEGYIKDFEQQEQDQKPYLVIFLKYLNGEAVIHEITRVSTPGRRHYEGARELRPVIGGLGISIVTTSRGIMTDRDARRHSVGGEVLCHVW